MELNHSISDWMLRLFDKLSVNFLENIVNRPARVFVFVVLLFCNFIMSNFKLTSFKLGVTILLFHNFIINFSLNSFISL